MGTAVSKSNTIHLISYSPLNTSKDEIRLLTLQPRLSRPSDSDAGHDGGDDEDGIFCSLQTVSLSSQPQYTALSYVWGDSTLCETITVDGKRTSITANLKEALTALRKEREACVLWVDAVCINQSDMAEKSVQVNMMQRIYSQAGSVNVWLGLADEASDVVMSTFASLGPRALAAGITALTMAEYKLMRQQAQQLDAAPLEPWLAESAGALDALSDEVGGGMPNPELDTFGRRPYWYRVWIMQEFVVAKQLTLVCGTRSLSYEHFAAAILFGSWHRTRRDRIHIEENARQGVYTKAVNEPDIEVGMIMTLVGARRRWLGQLKKPRDTLYELLIRTCLYHQYSSAQRASDIRDIVYGLLSMAADRKELGIEIDYHKSVEEVYTNAARALLRRGHMDILAWNQPAGVKSLPNLPSWVPDFSTPIRDACGQQREDSLFSAGVLDSKSSTSPPPSNIPSSVTPPPPPPPPPPLPSPASAFAPLTLTSYPLALIGDLVNPWTTTNVFDGYSTGAYFHTIETAISLLRPPPADSNHPHPHPLHLQTPERRAEAVWRMPTGDLAYDGSRNRATSALRASYDEVRGVMGRGKPGSGDEWLALAKGVREMSPGAFMYCICLGYQVGRQVFISGDGCYVGLVPEGAKVGDLVAVVEGARVPYVFRAADEGRNGRDGWVFVGEVYVDGVMDGEVLRAGSVEPVQLMVY